MSARLLVINPHPGRNPQFVEPLTEVLRAHGAGVQVANGGIAGERAAAACDRVIVTGVPLDAGYSLSEPAVQARVERELGWLRDCGRPVLGICYGHQVLGHLHGARVVAAERAVQDPQFALQLEDTSGCALLEGVDALSVFAEHRDYLAELPDSLRVLSRVDEVPYIIWHPDTRACGVQFVPELSGDSGRALLARFVG